jgi:hypothetical protein
MESPFKEAMTCFILIWGFLMIVCLVTIIDNSPGARCKRAFPSDGYKQELCTEYIQKDKSIEDIK